MFLLICIYTVIYSAVCSRITELLAERCGFGEAAHIALFTAMMLVLPLTPPMVVMYAIFLATSFPLVTVVFTHTDLSIMIFMIMVGVALEANIEKIYRRIRIRVAMYAILHAKEKNRSSQFPTLGRQV